MCVLMPRKRGKGSVGEGETGKKAKVTTHDCRIFWEEEYKIKTAAALQSYVTSSLVLAFIHTYMKSLAEDGSIKQTLFGPGNPRREFSVTVCHQPMNPSKQHA